MEIFNDFKAFFPLSEEQTFNLEYIYWKSE